jgi:hypothetical protein
MGYSAPQTTYVRARATERWGRIVPDISEKLQLDIAGCIDIHDFKDGTHLWSLMFAWPTHEHLQDATAKGIAELVRGGKAWLTLEDLPKLDIEVTEQIVDAAKPNVDGRDQLKAVQVLKPMATHAAKFCFVGDIRAAVAVDVKPTEEPLEAEGNFVK